MKPRQVLIDLGNNMFTFIDENNQLVQIYYKITTQEEPLPTITDLVEDNLFVDAVTREIAHKKTRTLNEIIWNKLTNVDLNHVKKRQLRDLLHKFSDIFKATPGLTNLHTHEIKMNVEKPFIKKSYPVPFAQREAVEDKFAEMEYLGVIKRATSP